MTTAGWITMILSVGLVTGLFAWCIFKVIFRAPEPEHLHGLDIDTKDTNGRRRKPRA